MVELVKWRKSQDGQKWRGSEQFLVEKNGSSSALNGLQKLIKQK